MNRSITNQRGLMKVLQIAPIALPIRPDLKYAGTERVIWNLDNKLVKRGIISQVASSANSNITGQLLPTIDVNVWSYTKDESEINDRYKEHLEKVIGYIKKENPDIVHDHDAGFILHNGFDFMDRDTPFISTLHYSDIDEESQNKWNNTPNEIKEKTRFIAISNSQKRYIEKVLGISIYKVIYHGLDLSKFPYSNNRKNYLLSVGRISSVKGQDLAIKVAKETGNNLIIAGPVQKFVQENIKFYNEKIKPNLDKDFSNRKKGLKNLRKIIESCEKQKGQILYVGEVNDKERNLLNQYAKCFLMPQRWREGFGLVMIEAMACGNPVIAFNSGSIPEIIRPGFNGYIVDNTEEMASKVEEIGKIRPHNCREDVQKRFNLEHQADEYVDVYSSIISHKL